MLALKMIFPAVISESLEGSPKLQRILPYHEAIQAQPLGPSTGKRNAKCSTPSGSEIATILA